MAGSYRTFLLRLVGFSIYVLVGGAIFMQIEKDKDENVAKLTFDDSLHQWIKTYNMSRENITALLQDYDSARERRRKPTWSFINSIYFVLQLVTTIGYGNITPKTPSGQIFTIAYAVAGIPLTVLALQSIGKLVNIGLRVANRPLHRKYHGAHCEEASCDFLEKGNICCSLICFVLTWIIVSATSACLDSEEPLVSTVYAIFVTYSTVGFGDIIPFEDHRYVFIITVLPGLSFLSSSIDSFVAYLEKSLMLQKRCFNCAKFLATKTNAKITTDEAQDTQEDINEHAV